MAGLAEMLRDGGGPPQGPGAGPGGPPDGPPGGDDAPDAGKMPPDQAVKILQHFQIPPDPKVLQMVCDAAQAGMDMLAKQGGQGGPDQGGPPPGAGPGGPPPPGA